MAKISNVLMLIGVLLLGFFAYELFNQNKIQDNSLKEATEKIENAQKNMANLPATKAVKTKQQKETEEVAEETKVGEESEANKNVQDQDESEGNKENFQEPLQTFQADQMEAFAILEIPKIDKQLAIVEGADEDALNKGVGHMKQTVYPGQGDQIVLSGHRDTVFRDFDKLEIGDTFIVKMPYGDFTYEIRETEIVDADDTSVVRPMGEEVLVVSTCFPFSYFGSAPDRFVAYAYPV